ncbi:hypothetical protein CRYUN_Cryun09bG0080600 [Craigia yunnanensis]
MEAPKEVAMVSKDHSNIVKGKRTKRLRPQSPIPFAITSNNSIYNGDGGEFEGIPNIENKNYTQYLSSSSSSCYEYQDSTEEEEDMANCLILLAQGQSRESTKLQADDDHHDKGIYNKFTSRRFMEAASNGTGKAGYYVYECKTCNRTFPSFQALGGHRASHKKPKATSAAALVDEKIRQFTAAAVSPDEGQFIKSNNLSCLSLQLSNNNRGLYSNNNKAKVHECSICGAEFTSGQALGGHMRRHRGPIGSNSTTTACTALSLTVPMPTESKEPKKSRNVLSLDLDLNLPAPEDDYRESKFPFAFKQQQQQQQRSPPVFSAPTLVDCHY